MTEKTSNTDDTNINNNFCEQNNVKNCVVYPFNIVMKYTLHNYAYH